MKKNAAFILSFFLLSLPLTALAAGLVPCGGPAPEKPCGFEDLVRLAQNIIGFLIKVGAWLGAIALVYIGWLYVTAVEDPGKISKAKGILFNVVIGFILMLGAWLIVKLIVTALGYDQGVNFLGS